MSLGRNLLTRGTRIDAKTMHWCVLIAVIWGCAAADRVWLTLPCRRIMQSLWCTWWWHAFFRPRTQGRLRVAGAKMVSNDGVPPLDLLWIGTVLGNGQEALLDIRWDTANRLVDRGHVCVALHLVRLFVPVEGSPDRMRRFAIKLVTTVRFQREEASLRENNPMMMLMQKIRRRVKDVCKKSEENRRRLRTSSNHQRGTDKRYEYKRDRNSGGYALSDDQTIAP